MEHINMLMTKEEYLASRRQWKEDYKQLSNLIKAEKIATRLMAKGGYSAVRHLQSVLAHDRTTARYMMEDLDTMKEVARLSKQILNSQEGRNYFIR